LADSIAERNSKIYDGKFNLVQLDKCIRGTDKIFVMVKVPEVKKVNIGTFHLASETYISSGAV